MNAEPRERRMIISLVLALTEDTNPKHAVPASTSALAASQRCRTNAIRPGATSCINSKRPARSDAHAHPIASCRTSLAAEPWRVTGSADGASRTGSERGTTRLFLDEAVTIAGGYFGQQVTTLNSLIHGVALC